VVAPPARRCRPARGFAVASHAPHHLEGALGPRVRAPCQARRSVRVTPASCPGVHSRSSSPRSRAGRRRVLAAAPGDQLTRHDLDGSCCGKAKQRADDATELGAGGHARCDGQRRELDGPVVGQGLRRVVLDLLVDEHRRGRRSPWPAGCASERPLRPRSCRASPTPAG
jgi:hypothetical protein